jgi:hypothetical protein
VVSCARSGSASFSPSQQDGCVLRRSWRLRAAVACFASVAVWAVFTCCGAPLALCALAALALAAGRWERRRPAALRVVADGLVTWDRQELSMPRHWRVTGCAQWGAHLLALTLEPAHGRSQTLVIPADALDAGTFRQIAVMARRSALAAL